MFKTLIKQWLFKEEKKKLERSRERFEALHKDQTEEFEKLKANLNVEDLVKQKLKGLPKVVEYDDDEAMEEEGTINFYRKAKDILDNPVFTAIVTRLATNQKELTWQEAKSLEEINFGRAWASGVVDVRDEVERLANLYVELTKKDGDFEEHDVI